MVPVSEIPVRLRYRVSAIDEYEDGSVVETPCWFLEPSGQTLEKVRAGTHLMIPMLFTREKKVGEIVMAPESDHIRTVGGQMNSVVHLVDSGGEDRELLVVLFGPESAGLDTMCRLWLSEMGETDQKVLDAGFVEIFKTDSFVKAAFECKRRGYWGNSDLNVFVCWLVRNHGWEASWNVWEYSLEGGEAPLYGCGDYAEWLRKQESIHQEMLRIRKSLAENNDPEVSPNA